MKLTSDYDDGGIKVWCDGKLIMHASHEQAKGLIRYLRDEWGIALQCKRKDRTTEPSWVRAWGGNEESAAWEYLQEKLSKE